MWARSIFVNILQFMYRPVVVYMKNWILMVFVKDYTTRLSFYEVPKISTQGCFSTVFSAGQPTNCKPHEKNFFSKPFNRFRSTQANHTKFGACFGLLLFQKDVVISRCWQKMYLSSFPHPPGCVKHLPRTKTLALIQSLNLLFDYLNLLISELI